MLRPATPSVLFCFLDSLRQIRSQIEACGYGEGSTINFLLLSSTHLNSVHYRSLASSLHLFAIDFQSKESFNGKHKAFNPR